MVAFANDAGLIITGKDLEEIQRILGDCYEEVHGGWDQLGSNWLTTKPKLCCLRVGRKWKPSLSTMHLSA